MHEKTNNTQNRDALAALRTRWARPGDPMAPIGAVGH